MLNKLERKFGKYAIKNLMVYIISFNFVVYIMTFIDQKNIILNTLMFDPGLILKGEVWRLITFIFIPPQLSILFILFALYFFYIIGIGLEEQWGSFKFNIYYLIGLLGTIISAFIAGGGASGVYLNMSLFLAFAYIFPNYQISLYLLLPIKIKYLAWLDVAMLVFSFFTGNIPVKFAIIASMANFILFFGKDIFFYLKNRKRSYTHKKEYLIQVPTKDVIHRCTVCGITEKDDKNMMFRYCDSCEGDYEYCMLHLKEHDHVHMNDNLI